MKHNSIKLINGKYTFIFVGPWWNTERFSSEKEWEAWADKQTWNVQLEEARKIILGGRSNVLPSLIL